jgi:hypothetical protein
MNHDDRLMIFVCVVIVALMILVDVTHAAAPASTVAIRDALDQEAQSIAADEGWVYIDRHNVGGDWRRYRAELCFLIPQDNPDVTFTMDVEAVAVRLSLGHYQVTTPLDTLAAPLPAWNYQPNQEEHHAR